MLLSIKAQERRDREADRLTLAANRAIATYHSKDAADRFNRRLAERARQSGARPQTASEFSATMARLAAIPGSRVRVN